MRIFFILGYAFSYSFLFAQGVSYRIEALGKEMAGIVSDFETDLFRNPAYLAERNILRGQRAGFYESEWNDSYYYWDYYFYDRFSFLLTKSPFGFLVDGYGRFRKYKTYEEDFREKWNFFLHGLGFFGVKEKAKSYGISIEGELKEFYFKWTRYRDSYSWRANMSYRVKVGLKWGEGNFQEIVFSLANHKDKWITHTSEYLKRDSGYVKFIPRLSYLFSQKRENKNFRFLITAGEFYSLREKLESLFVNKFPRLENRWGVKLTFGWEDASHPKLLIGYAGLYEVTAIYANDAIRSFNHRIAIPFSLEYRPFSAFALRAGVEARALLKGLPKSKREEEREFYLGCPYSLGFGVWFKKLTVDFVLPSRIVYLYRYYWQAEGEIFDFYLWKMRLGIEF